MPCAGVPGCDGFEELREPKSKLPPKLEPTDPGLRWSLAVSSPSVGDGGRWIHLFDPTRSRRHGRGGAVPLPYSVGAGMGLPGLGFLDRGEPWYDGIRECVCGLPLLCVFAPALATGVE